MAFLTTTRPGTLPLSSGLSPARRRVVLAVVIVASIAGAIAIGSTTVPVGAADSDLVHLLRLMAVLKAAMSATIIGAVMWRLEAPATPLRLAAYAAACGAAAGGPVLIWTGAHLVAGAALLHGGLAAGILLLWRDPAVGARLLQVIAARRAARR